MKLNLTNIAVTIGIFLIGWLVVPSPFHKCPVPLAPIVVKDTLWLDPKPIELEPIVSIDDEMIAIHHEHISLAKDSTDWYEIDLLTFQKESHITLPELKVPILSPITNEHGYIVGQDTIGIVRLMESDGLIRSTTFYELGDTIAQTIHEVAITPRPIDIILFPIIHEFEVEPVALPQEPTPILASPVTWGLIGVLVGGLVVLIIVNNDKDKEHAN